MAVAEHAEMLMHLQEALEELRKRLDEGEVQHRKAATEMEREREAGRRDTESAAEAVIRRGGQRFQEAEDGAAVAQWVRCLKGLREENDAESRGGEESAG
jgi:predicted phage tail protein